MSEPQQETSTPQENITRRDAVKKIAATTGGFLLGAETLQANIVKKIGESVLKKAAAEVGEKSIEFILSRNDIRHTRNANKNVQFDDLLENQLFLVETNEDINSFFNRDDEIVAKGLIKQLVKEVFKGKSVASIEKVRKETAERQELRANEEIDQNSLPDKRTIKREGIEIDFGFQVDIKSHRLSDDSIEEDLKDAIREFTLSSTDVEFVTAMTHGTLIFRDAATQTEEVIFPFRGTSLDLTDLTIRSIKRQQEKRVDMSKSSDFETLRLDSFKQALTNAKSVLLDLKGKKSRTR